MSGLMPVSKLYFSYSSARSRLTRPLQIRATEGFGVGWVGEVAAMLEFLRVLAKHSDGVNAAAKNDSIFLRFFESMGSTYQLAGEIAAPC
jgi:hypothetical protein